MTKIIKSQGPATDPVTWKIKAIGHQFSLVPSHGPAGAIKFKDCHSLVSHLNKYGIHATGTEQIPAFYREMLKP